MKKLKDIFYDKNDILIALVIVSVAALVIVTRIDSILAYPASLIADSGTSVDEPDEPVIYSGNDNQNDTENVPEESNTVENPGQQDSEGINDSEGNIDSEGSKDPDESKNTDESKVENYTINIESGSTGEQIAEILKSKGLIESKQEFYNAVTAAGADKKLKAGDFTIPSNSTPAEVIAIITR